MKTNLLAAGMLLATLSSGFGQPVITNQPSWLTNGVGSTATFSVGATGATPLSYQWRFGAADRPGATSATLVLTNVQTGNQGIYTVVITNVAGAVTSSAARLYVITLPTITQHPTPTNPSVSLGAVVTFIAAASGFTTGTNYQWRLNGVALPGRTNATLVLSNVQSVDAGAYSLVVTNLAGSATSRVAILVVDPTFIKITTGPIVTDKNNYWNGSWADYDNDGYLDLFVGTWFNSNTNHLYHNNGDGTFTRVPAVNIPKIPSNQHGASWGDLDNDGYLDLMVTAGNPEITQNVLYRNNGNGTFTPITTGPIYAETYVGGFHAPSWVDYDNDGFLDVFIAGHAAQNRLFRNNGDGTFARITNSAVVSDIGASEGRTWVDYDNDGHVDLFVCNAEPYKNALYRNNGDATFTRITNTVLSSTVEDSVACAWGDYNNDGYLDLFVANAGFTTSRTNSLYRNNGDGTFTKLNQGSIVNDLPIGHFNSCAWGDYDNDGYLDLFVTTGNAGLHQLVKNYLYHNSGDGTFTRILEGSQVNDFGNSTAASWVDYDNDGFLDLFVSNGAFWAEFNGGELLTNFLYRNNGNGNRWITLRLVGTVSNRSAIGAKVRVKAKIGGNSIWQVRQIFGGDSESNEQPLDAHFGLADATNIDHVRIEWPSGTVQELRDVAVNRFLTVTEPPRLMSPRLTNGVFGFKLKGGRGLQYIIQRSTNAQNWALSSIVTVTNLNGTAEFTEPVDMNITSRLYRTVSP